MESILKILPIIGSIIYLLTLLRIDRKLIKLFKVEEKPLNNERELDKIRAEINKARTKEEKETEESIAIKELSDVELIRAVAQLKPKRSDKRLFKKLEQNK